MEDRMSVIQQEQLLFLQEQMKELCCCCIPLYQFHSYACHGYSKKFSRDYREDLDTAERICSEIDRSICQGTDLLPVIYKAEALCYMGAVYTAKGKYDIALEYLNKSAVYIEDYSLAYTLPSVYAADYIYMGKCYLEKHSSTGLIEKCHRKADEMLSSNREKKVWRTYEFPGLSYDELKLELVLQQAIAELDLYGQRTQFEERRALDYLLRADGMFLKCMESQSIDRSWIEKQEQTLQGTKGEFFKSLYFKACDILERQTDTENKRDKETEIIRTKAESVRYILNEYDTAQTNGIKGSEAVYKDIRQYPGKVSASGETGDIDFPALAGLVRSCFNRAFVVFAALAEKYNDNTMAYDNMAILLYDYDQKGNEKERHTQKYYDKAFLHEYIAYLSKNAGKLDKDGGEVLNPGFKDWILRLLDHALKKEKNNMFALNLKAVLSNRVTMEKESEYYPVLRQSLLKKRFKEMDRILAQSSRDSELQIYMEDIKISLIQLHHKVVNYMNLAIVDFGREETKNLSIGHYTKLDVVPKLINQKRNARLQIQNVHHMNDPLEGRLFIQQITRTPEAVCGTAGKPNLIIEEIKRLYTSDMIGTVRNSVYMGSFTSELNKLTMWSRYGDSGKGCCLEIDAARFFDSSTKIPLAEISANEDIVPYKLEDTKYPLYTVVYFPEALENVITAGEADQVLNNYVEYIRMRAEVEKKFYPLEGYWWETQGKLIEEFMILKEDLGKLLYNMNDSLGRIHDYCIRHRIKTPDGLSEEVRNTIMLILDLVRYLFKSGAYIDEREYRIIQHSTNPECKEESGGMSKLYINVEKPMKYKKVWFGPLVQNFDSSASYILNVKKEGQKNRSKTTWQLEVCKSELPYR